jgi:hypothetical protein
MCILSQDWIPVELMRRRLDYEPHANGVTCLCRRGAWVDNVIKLDSHIIISTIRSPYHRSSDHVDPLLSLRQVLPKG